MSILNLISATGANNNGGAVLRGGQKNPFQNYLDIKYVSGNNSLDGYPRVSQPVLSKDTRKSLTNELSVFAYNGREIIKGYTAFINYGSFVRDMSSKGSSTEVINQRTNIHYTTSNVSRWDTKAIRSGNYNQYTGKFDESYPVIVGDSFGLDTAARLTRQLPGTLTVLINKSPVVKNYLSKTT
jgi:hypothetical protein